MAFFIAQTCWRK